MGLVPCATDRSLPGFVGDLARIGDEAEHNERGGHGIAQDKVLNHSRQNVQAPEVFDHVRQRHRYADDDDAESECASTPPPAV